jgi:predicted CoA-binding protein
MPSSVAELLAGKRFAVARVSRQPQQAANAIYRKLHNSGFDVFPVNPNATEIEGVHYCGAQEMRCGRLSAS